MMSYVPDESTRRRLMQECCNTFPGLPQNLILAVLHENKYEPARAYSMLQRYHQDLTQRPRTAPDPNVYRHSPQRTTSYHPGGGQYQPRPPPVPLHHSQSDSAILHHYGYPPLPYPPPHQQQQQPQYNVPHNNNWSPAQSNQQQSQYHPNYRNSSTPPPSGSYGTHLSRSPTPGAYHLSRSPTPSSYSQSRSPIPNAYASPPPFTQHQKSPFVSQSQQQQQILPPPTQSSPRHQQNYQPNQGELFVDVSGACGRHYENMNSAALHMVTPPDTVPHRPQQCTDPHPPSLLHGGEGAVSPIDMRVPQLAFPAIQPAQSPSDSPRTGQRRKTGIHEDTHAYANALILQQRARMSKLHKHLIEKKQRLDRLSKEVLEKETELLKRDNERVKPEPIAKLTENNRKLQVQIQLMSQEIEHYTSGTSPLGVIDPNRQDNFHQSMTESGQAGPMRLPDNTPVTVCDPPTFSTPEDEGEQWDCPTCTFKNHPALDKCECCEVSRNTRLPH